MFKKFILVLMILSTSLFAQNLNLELKSTINKSYHLHTTDEGIKIDEWKRGGILLVFFGTHCPPCKAEIPKLKEIQRHRNGLLVFAIQVEQSVSDEEVTRFVKMHHINYPVVNYTYAMSLILFMRDNLDWGGEIPTMYLFAKDGSYIKTYVGITSKRRILEDFKHSKKEY